MRITELNFESRNWCDLFYGDDRWSDEEIVTNNHQKLDTHRPDLCVTCGLSEDLRHQEIVGAATDEHRDENDWNSIDSSDADDADDADDEDDEDDEDGEDEDDEDEDEDDDEGREPVKTNANFKVR